MARSIKSSQDDSSDIEAEYATNMNRIGAYIFDMAIFFIPLVLAKHFYLPEHFKKIQHIDLLIYIAGHIVLAFISAIFISKLGATFGKLIAQIEVVDKDELTFLPIGKAFFRELFGKQVSGFLYIGYFLAFIRNDHRSLHDFFAGTIVIKKISNKYESRKEMHPTGYEKPLSMISAVVVVLLAIGIKTGDEIYITPIVKEFSDLNKVTNKEKDYLIKSRSQLKIEDLKYNPHIIKGFKDEDLKNEEFVTRVLKTNIKALEWAPESIVYTDTHIRIYIDKSNGKFEFAPEKMKKHPNFKTLVAEYLKDLREKEESKLADLKDLIDERNRLNDLQKFTARKQNPIKAISRDPKQLLVMPKVFFDESVINKIIVLNEKAVIYIPDGVIFSESNVRTFVFAATKPEKSAPNRIKNHPSFQRFVKEKKEKMKSFEVPAPEKRKHLLKILVANNFNRLGDLKNDFQGLNPKVFEDLRFINKILPYLNWSVSIDKYLPEKMKYNKTFISLYIKSSARKSYEEIPPALQENKRLITYFLTKSPRSYEFLPKKFLNNKRYALLSLKRGVSSYKYMTDKMRKDKDILNQLIKKWSPDPSGKRTLLELIPEELMKNKKLVIRVLKKDPISFSFLNDTLKKDPAIAAFIKDIPKQKVEAFFRNVLKHKGSTVHVPEEYRNNKEILERLISVNTRYLYKFPESFRNDPALFKKTINIKPKHFEFSDWGNGIKKNKEFVLMAVKLKRGSVYSMDKSFYDDWDVLKVYIESCRDSRRCFNNSFDKSFMTQKTYGDSKKALELLKVNPAFILFLSKDLTQNPLILPYYKKHYLVEKEKFMHHIETQLQRFETRGSWGIPFLLRSDRTAVKSYIKLIPMIYHQISDELKNDKEIVELFLKQWKLKRTEMEHHSRTRLRMTNYGSELSLTPLSDLPKDYRENPKYITLGLETDPISWISLTDKEKSNPLYKKFESIYKARKKLIDRKKNQSAF